MKTGDLVKLPQDQGYAIVYEIIHSRPDTAGDLHPYSTVAVVRDWGLDCWDADACEVISESR